MTNREQIYKHFDLIILDLLSVILSFLISFYGYFIYLFREIPHFDMSNGAYRIIIALIILLHLFYSFLGESYSVSSRQNSVVELRGIIWHTIKLVGTVLFVLFFLKESATYSRMVIAIFFCTNILLTFAFRVLYRKYISRGKGLITDYSKHLLIVTEKTNADILSNLFKTEKTDEYVFVASADENTYLATIKENVIDDVLISISNETRREEIVDTLLDLGLTVHIDIGKFFKETPNSHISNICDRSVITTAVNPITFRQAVIKRFADIVIALFGLLFTVILFVIFAPIIFIQSPGHVIFKQKRVGKNGRVFDFYKFRSMYPDAEERKNALLNQNKMDGLMFKMDNDPRIIPIGHFLRKSSLDEFPQFLNVLKGDMSLVGTRPPTLDEYEKYTLYHASRLSIKPGITGLWQISGRSNITDFEEVVKLDRDYIRNFSLMEDLRIMFKTVIVVFTGKGSQ